MYQLNWLVISVFLLSSIQLLGQGVPNSFDTIILNEALDKAEHDTVRLEILMRLGEAYRIENPEKGRFYYNSVLSKSPAEGFEVFRAKAYIMLGVLKQYEAQYDSSLYFCTLARKEAYKTRDTNLITQTLNNEASLLGHLGHPNQAGDFFLESIELSRSSGDTIRLLEGILNLSNLKASNKKYAQALQIIDREMGLWQEAPEYIKAQFQYLKGNSLLAQKNYDTALVEYRILKPVLANLPDPYNYLQLLDNMAITYLELGYLDSAMQLNIEAELVQKRIGDVRGWGNRILTRARIFKAQNKLDSASVYAAKAVSLLEEQLEPSSYLSALSFWADLEALRENWKLSRELTDKVLVLFDSITTESRVKSFDSLMLVHEVAEKEAALFKAKQESEIEKLQKQRSWLLMLGILILVTVGVGYLLRQRQLQIKKLAFERDEKEKDLAAARKELRDKLEEVSNYKGDVSELKEHLALLKAQQQPLEEKLRSADIFNILKRNLKEDADWSLFKQYFAESNQHFLHALKDGHPQLTANDVRLLSLIRLHLSNNEIAVLFNIVPDSVRKARSRIVKKMHLASDKDLYPYLIEIG